MVGGGKLKPSMYDEFDEFCQAIVFRFKSQPGIDLYAMGLRDEPEFVEGYPSCVYTKNEMLETYRHVRKKI